MRLEENAKERRNRLKCRNRFSRNADWLVSQTRSDETENSSEALECERSLKRKREMQIDKVSSGYEHETVERESSSDGPSLTGRS